jgi:hypothetical protein
MHDTPWHLFRCALLFTTAPATLPKCFTGVSVVIIHRENAAVETILVLQVILKCPNRDCLEYTPAIPDRILLRTMGNRGWLVYVVDGLGPTSRWLHRFNAASP